MSLSDPVWVPLWVAIVAGIPGILTAVASALNMRAMARLKVQIHHSRLKLDQIETNTNDKMDKLLEAKDQINLISNEANFQAGKLEGSQQK